MRLTERNKHTGKAILRKLPAYEEYDPIARLAAYEETGLEPEEVKNWQDIYNEILTRTYGPFHQKIADWLKAEQDGRLVVPPVKPGDTVHVDARTLPYNYLHPADGCRDFARCEVVSIVTTGAGTYLKLRALYPSRAGRRDYLRYIVGAIGKTVFLTREEAEKSMLRAKLAAIPEVEPDKLDLAMLAHADAVLESREGGSCDA